MAQSFLIKQMTIGKKECLSQFLSNFRDADYLEELDERTDNVPSLMIECNPGDGWKLAI